MTQSITIHRDKAIEAIWNEPVLKQGKWFHQNDELGMGGVSVKTCEVCAVGSVLRSHCFTTMDHRVSASYIAQRLATHGDHASYEERFMLYENQYLSNLSMAFEYWTDEGVKPNSKQMKLHLQDVISMHWPKQFTLEWEG